MGIRSLARDAVFRQLHGRNLIYNACWEDPRLDAEALALGPTDRVMVITSAGCNALDYALSNPERIDAVDMNPRQNALLELKIAGIRRLDHEKFFAIFGRGRSPDFREVYGDCLRRELTLPARRFWDRRQHLFCGAGRRPSFYFRGTTGFFAFGINAYIDRAAKARDAVDAILNADCIDRQREIYESRLKPVFWTGLMRWLMGRDTCLALLGVPGAQRRQIDERYPGGVVRFVEDAVESVFTRLPLTDNYFWRVYLTGEYDRNCCPRYLRKDCFDSLKSGLVDRIRLHTGSIQSFLRSGSEPISRFVLLDHMDWLAGRRDDLLQAEWQGIVDRAAPTARVIWRSAGLEVDFVDPLRVVLRGRDCRIRELLEYHRPLAETLHRRDRVHTYGSFYIADLVGA